MAFGRVGLGIGEYRIAPVAAIRSGMHATRRNKCGPATQADAGTEIYDGRL